MARCLIVANQTLGGEELASAVSERIQRGGSRFFVLVPMTVLKHEAAEWNRGFIVGAQGLPPDTARSLMESDARRREAEFDEARRRSEGRMEQMIETIRAAGGEADGKVGDADPVLAVEDVLQSESFDEVIVSTLPNRVSRWLRMDLPSRVSRMTEAPVTTVEAND